MEDDDEFGDLYTNILQSFESSQPSSAPAPQSLHRPIDLNLNLKNEDDDEILIVALQSNPNSQTLAPANSVPTDSTSDGDSAGGPRVLEAKDVKLSIMDSNRNVDLMEKDVNFDIEEEEGNNGISDMGLDAVISGLSDVVPVNNSEPNMEGSRRDDDDWESDDSEDDLQIVLYDNNPHGPMAMERGGNGEDDDDDGLVIVVDSELNQLVEDQEWGEEREGRKKNHGETKMPMKKSHDLDLTVLVTACTKVESRLKCLVA